MNVDINPNIQSLGIFPFTTIPSIFTHIPSFTLSPSQSPPDVHWVGKSCGDQPEGGIHCDRHHTCRVCSQTEQSPQHLLKSGQPEHMTGIDIYLVFSCQDTYSRPYMKGLTATDSLQHTAANKRWIRNCLNRYRISYCD